VLLNLRILQWVGSARRDLKALPAKVREEVGQALYEVQLGLIPWCAKPLKRFGFGVMEIKNNYNTNTYRAVYAFKLSDVVYVLHVFQKKSKVGKKIPKEVRHLIRERLLLAKNAAKKEIQREKIK